MPLNDEYSMPFHAVVNVAPWTGPEFVWTTDVRWTSALLNVNTEKKIDKVIPFMSLECFVSIYFYFIVVNDVMELMVHKVR